MSTVRLTLARFTPADRTAWLASATMLLDDDERERLAQTAGDDARTQHALGWALIRLTGATVSGRPAAEVALGVSATGKPALADIPHLHVSIAHCVGLVAVADSDAAAVGIDVEPVRRGTGDPRRLAERFFSEPERAALRALPDDAVDDWFASAWTVKEAVGKALGTGMVPALAGAVVAGHAGAMTLASVWSGPPAADWTLAQLVAPGGSERVTVATPVAGVATVTRSLTLRAFADACAAGHL